MPSGIPVVVSSNGRGIPVRAVASGAPVMTVATNGLGTPIVLTDRGAPFVVQGLYDPAANALFARLNTPPTSARKTLINNLIVSLKTAGVWSKLDAVYMLAAADSQASRQNWIADQYNPTPVSSPTFVVDRGYTGDGSASYLDTGFNPTTAVAPKFTQNSAHMGLWSRTNFTNPGPTQSFDMGEQTRSYLSRSSNTSGAMTGRVNSASGVVDAALGAYPGHAAWSRSGAALWEAYAQGLDVGGGTTASAALANANFRLLSSNPVYGVNQLASAHFGSDLGPSEMLALKNAINTYLTAVGAA